MSHNVGSVETLTPVVAVGPSSGTGQTGPATWEHEYPPAGVASNVKFVLLHFRNAVIPPDNVLEVQLGYGTDRFTTADGPEFWTRPINPYTLAGGKIRIRYLANGSPTGGAEIDKYGVGLSLPGEPGHPSMSNCDPFLVGSTYPEPTYDPYWFCNDPPRWDDVACVASSDVRAQVARSVGMIVTVDDPAIGTCTVTLIDDEIVVTAGHCLFSHHGHTPEALAASSSVTFDYLTACSGPKPAAATFHKVRRLDEIRFEGSASGVPNDWAFLQLTPGEGGIGVPPLPMRTSVPAAGEPVFGIHHPNGAVKKVSPRSADGFAAVSSSTPTGIVVPIDISGGSSGSPLFDASGQLVGVLTGVLGCPQDYCPSASFLAQVAEGLPVTTRDVMIVFDRSGSMDLDGGAGRKKIEDARDAASLFVRLVRVSAGNRVGLVSFSTTATSPVDFGLTGFDATAKDALIGPAPYSSGVVGGLMPGGNTTIGGGLDAARAQFPTPGDNPRAILLLTDGLQNTPPMAEAIAPSLTGIELHAIGFGTEASLDGALLSRLAQERGGLYTRAGTGLDLKKFFALAFGNIFASGMLVDPARVLKRGEKSSVRDMRFRVCNEEAVTVVVGWDREEVALELRVKTPNGVVVDGAAPGIEGDAGRTWRFMRIPLPYEGERSGDWGLEIRRAKGSKAHTTRYFVSVIPDGGPRLTPWPTGRHYYTGDTINPLVRLGYPNGGFPVPSAVSVTIAKPAGSAGDYLRRRRKLEPPGEAAGDGIPARNATLDAAPASASFRKQASARYELFDDIQHEDGTMRRDGVFGNPLEDVLTVEGSYELHFRARYSTGECKGTREALQSVYVEIGVDERRSTLNSRVVGKPGQRPVRLRLTLVPRDRYGNHLGPGRAGAFSLGGSRGTKVTGHVHDNGDGSYSVRAAWDPRSPLPPGVVVKQPGRDTVVIHAPRRPGTSRR